MEKAPQIPDCADVQDRMDLPPPKRIEMTSQLKQHLTEIAQQAMQDAPAGLEEEVAINAVAAELSELEQIMYAFHAGDRTAERQ